VSAMPQLSGWRKEDNARSPSNRDAAPGNGDGRSPHAADGARSFARLALKSRTSTPVQAITVATIRATLGFATCRCRLASSTDTV
jgi:hypothetical protein